MSFSSHLIRIRFNGAGPCFVSTASRRIFYSAMFRQNVISIPSYIEYIFIGPFWRIDLLTFFRPV
jgi:hypothetical protein